MTFVLRKSYGPYSAGTRVDEYLGEGEGFEKDGLFIPFDMVVKRREGYKVVHRNDKDMEKLYGTNE